MRPGKGRTNDMRNLLPVNRTNFKTDSCRETFCLFLGWDSVAVLKKPVMLYVLKFLPRGVFEVWQWEQRRLERMGLRLKTCVV